MNTITALLAVRPERANARFPTFAPWYILIPLVFAGDVVVAALAWTIVGSVMR